MHLSCKAIYSATLLLQDQFLGGHQSTLSRSDKQEATFFLFDNEPVESNYLISNVNHRTRIMVLCTAQDLWQVADGPT